MATSSEESQQSEFEATPETERREARVGETPDGDPVVTIVLSATQLTMLGVESPDTSIEYTVKEGRLRIQ